MEGLVSSITNFVRSSSILSVVLISASHTNPSSVHDNRSIYFRPEGSHCIVVRTASPLGANPGNDLEGVGDVAGLAVHTIRGVEFEVLSGAVGFIFHYVT